MGGRIWSKQEEVIFWKKLIPHSPKRLGKDLENEEKSWEWVAQEMTERMGKNARLEHYFQNTYLARFSPNVGRMAVKYWRHEQKLKKQKLEAEKVMENNLNEMYSKSHKAEPSASASTATESFKSPHEPEPPVAEVSTSHAAATAAPDAKVNAHYAGGMTPTVDELRSLLENLSSSEESLAGCNNMGNRPPVLIMVRPRGPPSPTTSVQTAKELNHHQDFIYTDDEIDEMKGSISNFVKSGLLDPSKGDGFVFGLLQHETAIGSEAKLSLNVQRTTELTRLVSQFRCVLHRAVDDLFSQAASAASAETFPDTVADLMIQIRDCGFSGILTSGGRGSAIDNAGKLKTIIRAGKNVGIEVTLGGGLMFEQIFGSEAIGLLYLRSEDLPTSQYILKPPQAEAVTSKMNTAFNSALKQRTAIRKDLASLTSPSPDSPSSQQLPSPAALGSLSAALTAFARTIDEYQSLAKQEINPAKQEKAFERIRDFRADLSEFRSQLAALKAQREEAAYAANRAELLGRRPFAAATPENPYAGSSTAIATASGYGGGGGGGGGHARSTSIAESGRAGGYFGSGDPAREAHALREQQFFASAHSALDEYIARGQAVLGDLGAQREMLKSTQRKLYSVGNTLGISGDTIRMIERRAMQDKWIFWGGVMVFFAFCWLVLHFLR
ncbi:uncharacterized protein CTHT_0064910 [Thermochaetoides thermophila DSM 1495]|uniref:Copper homeostasis protein cutC homolog n=1 Tax=Chaetomium thermophilum (strain DSM 1495 / CBS 144.50 / IMI 039719) TaxID=759272 RepID=G0SG37_CHATD|nr:hypothetical protein CTHT_0064910 [Thermochaetoides thermophila DSM 1495]EGS17176.1 hypothetical protein CTHT_0064910 [Thermochaetoides thermophila DSM 1495]